MLTVPQDFAIWMTSFAPWFTTRVWPHVQVLLVGAILAPGTRTVTAALRDMGSAQAQCCQPSPRGLNRAVWSSLAGARLWLVLGVSMRAPAGPLSMGRDDPLARRRGAKSQAHGMYRDAGRAAHRHRVTARGWRWWRLRRLVSMPWATRVGAVPFLTGLAPSEPSPPARGQRHKTRTAWARPRLLVVRRWLPARPLGGVTERRCAVMTRVWRARQRPHPLGGLTRWRRDAALDEPAPPRAPRPTGRPRLPGRRLPTWAHARREADPCGTTVTVRRWEREDARAVEGTSATGVWSPAGRPPRPSRGVWGREPPGQFEPQAWLCTALPVAPGPILAWLVLRWRLEVPWQEARAHWGMEPQRQWPERALARPPPALLGLFSSVTLSAGRLAPEHTLPVRQAGWAHTALPTVAEAIAIVPQHWWTSTPVSMAPTKADRVEIPCALLNRWTETRCSAA
jgi:hypothetical protein